MKDIVSEVYLQDGNFYPADKLPDSCFSREVIYEVIRFMKGKPLFLYDHLNRLINSIKREGYEIPDQREIIEGIKLFAGKVALTAGNVKVLLRYNAAGELFSFYVYKVAHRYPDPELYQRGVNTITTHIERKNPVVKRWNPFMRQKIEQIRKEKAVFEVLMVDQSNHITEGSKSNLFFMKGSELVTPPENSVLPGITRQKVIELCSELNIPVSFKKIPYSQLQYFSEAFLTGTSPKILPIRKIDDFEFTVASQMVKKLMQAYDELIRNEIRKSSF